MEAHKALKDMPYVFKNLSTSFSLSPEIPSQITLGRELPLIYTHSYCLSLLLADFCSVDLPDPQIEPVPPALQLDSLLLNHQGMPT